MNKRVLFCNIAYMEYYDIDLHEETPEYGGSYVAETGDALEKYNFHTCNDGIVRGFVETKYRDSYKSARQPNQLNINNIDVAYKGENCITNVTVVFCAYSKTIGKSVIVGWYKNATVFRGREMYENRQYNICCDSKDAYLIDVKKRQFSVPRARQDGFGFGQANVWYAKEEKSHDYILEVLKYLEDNNYTCEDDIPQILPEEYGESGIAQKVLVNRYERNQNARKKCLEVYGSKCKICGFTSGDFYGEEFSNKIEVHHIVPIHKIDETYKVNPQKDLIPVCPNCHMILHTKMKNGEYPSIEYLKSKIR